MVYLLKISIYGMGIFCFVFLFVANLFVISELIRVFRHELDHLDTPDKYPEGFLVTLDLVVSTREKQLPPQSCPWNKFNAKASTPRLLFSRKEEFNDTMDELGKLYHVSGPSVMYLYQFTLVTLPCNFDKSVMHVCERWLIVLCIFQ